MSSGAPRSRPNKQILDEAAEWFVEVDSEDLSPATRQSFDEWLRKSPEHVRAFLELLPVWEGAAAARPKADTDPETLISEFLSARTEVVQLRDVISTGTAAQGLERENAKRVLRKYLPVAACIVMIVAGVLVWVQSQRNVYETGVGEQRSLVLEDGSSLELNARSKVRIRFAPSERDVELLEGQALFYVTKDSSRPFVVLSGNTRVRAVGTQFDVYRKRSGTIVTVIEGRVAVTAGAGLTSPSASSTTAGEEGGVPASTVELIPGQQITISAAVAPHPTRADVAAATAWTQHRLAFQKASLAEVVEEFNRYNRRQLQIEDKTLEGFLVSGTFSSTDPISLLRFLRTQPGIRVVETTGVVRIVSN